jgi:hypothetical protein
MSLAYAGTFGFNRTVYGDSKREKKMVARIDIRKKKRYRNIELWKHDLGVGSCSYFF